MFNVKKSKFPPKLIALTLALLLTALNLPFASFAKEGGAGTITDHVTVLMKYEDGTTVPIPETKISIKGALLGTNFLLGKDYYVTKDDGKVTFKQTSRMTKMFFELPDEWKSKVEPLEAKWVIKPLASSNRLGNASLVPDKGEFRIGMLYAWDKAYIDIYLKAKKFNVTFDLNGGDGTAPDTQSVEYLKTATKPQDPVRVGHVFQGWYEEGKDSPFDFNTPIKDNVTLKAKWEVKKYTVSFVDEDGTSLANSQTVEHGKTASNPGDPTKEGYLFKGWKLNGNDYDFDTPVTSDIKLVAQWQQNQQEPQEEEQEYKNTKFFVCVVDDTALHYPVNFREITAYEGKTIKTPKKLFQTEQTSQVEDGAELLNKTTYGGQSKSEFETDAATDFTQEYTDWNNVKLKVYRLVKVGDSIHIDLKMIGGQNSGGGSGGENPGGGETGNDNGSNGGENGNDNGSNGGETGNDNGSNGGETGNDNGSNGGETGNDNGSNGGETGNDNGSNGGETGNDNGSNGGETGNDNGSNGGETGNDNGSNGGETGNDNGSNGDETGNDIEPSNAPDSNPTVEENRDDGADVETIDEDATPLGALDYENYYAYIQGDDKGRVNAEDFVTREQAATIFFRLLEPQYKESIISSENAFIDVPVALWSNNYISTLTKGGLLSGYADGRFLPREFITRAELAALAAKFDHLSLRTSHDFVDIKGHWAEKYIASAAEKGWVRGYVNNQFRPNEFLTRAELVSFVNNVLGRSVLSKELPEGYKTFSDLHPDAWYYETILAAANSYQAAKRDNGYQIWNKILLSLNDK